MAIAATLEKTCHIFSLQKTSVKLLKHCINLLQDTLPNLITKKLLNWAPQFEGKKTTTKEKTIAKSMKNMVSFAKTWNLKQKMPHWGR